MLLLLLRIMFYYVNAFLCLRGDNMRIKTVEGGQLSYPQLFTLLCELLREFILFWGRGNYFP